MCMTTVGKDAGYNLFGSRHELECLQTNGMVSKKEDTEYDQMILLYSSFSFLLLFCLQVYGVVLKGAIHVMIWSHTIQSRRMEQKVVLFYTTRWMRHTTVQFCNAHVATCDQIILCKLGFIRTYNAQCANNIGRAQLIKET